jgi:hypothetical protein
MKMTEYCIEKMNDIFDRNRHSLEVLKSQGLFDEYRKLLYDNVVASYHQDEADGLALLRKDGGRASDEEVVARCKVVLWFVIYNKSDANNVLRRDWAVPKSVVSTTIRDCLVWQDQYYEVRR